MDFLKKTENQTIDKLSNAKLSTNYRMAENHWFYKVFCDFVARQNYRQNYRIPAQTIERPIWRQILDFQCFF